MESAKPSTTVKNKFDISEWAGAFGDLGTLIPFIVGYITIGKMDPLGILFMFGILLICAGMYYKTPLPVQPMKAIGGAAIIQAGVVTPGMIWGAGLFTGLFWLCMGLTGAMNIISRWMARPVIFGITFGLGFSFIMEGIRLMREDFAIAVPALIITFFLLQNKRFPAMFALLVFGVAANLYAKPWLLQEVYAIHFDFRLPQFALGSLTMADFLQGAFVLAIPQIPLTFGNAVIAIVAENNRLFPAHPVTERKVAISQGIMNLIAPLLGGIPVCHGAGGLAGHVRFGARTGGALIILGVLLLVVALGFSRSVSLIFQIFPSSVLGVILFFAGLELAMSIRRLGDCVAREDYYVLLITAGFAVWNMGAGFLAGVILHELLQRKILRL
jgi:MFS superfamily sulfate permease-like transporter